MVRMPAGNANNMGGAEDRPHWGVSKITLGTTDRHIGEADSLWWVRTVPRSGGIAHLREWANSWNSSWKTKRGRGRLKHAIPSPVSRVCHSLLFTGEFREFQPIPVELEENMFFCRSRFLVWAVWTDSAPCLRENFLIGHNSWWSRQQSNCRLGQMFPSSTHDAEQGSWVIDSSHRKIPIVTNRTTNRISIATNRIILYNAPLSCQ